MYDVSSRWYVILVYLILICGRNIFSAEQRPISRTDKLMHDLFYFWEEGMRVAENGAYCAGNYFSKNVPCSTSDRYSSAGVGMALIAECVFTELGFLKRAVAKANVKQTLITLRDQWPKERFHGFYVHFTTGSWSSKGQYSTVDTAELIMGALFAGNYFGGDINSTAIALARNISWSDAIKASDNPTIWPVANSSTGEMTGNIRPFNEYYIVAYIAKSFDPNPKSKAFKYFETYFGTSGPPIGLGGYPVHKAYKGYDLLTDNKNKFMSSFIPQFCWFQTKGFHTNLYYSQTLFPAWLNADIAYWDNILDEDSEVWGHKIKGKVFGSGAGPGHDKGYTVNRINGTEEHIFSAAIMAGFLGAANVSLKAHINEKLSWLYENEVCTYQKVLPSGLHVKIPWRCSIKNPTWRADHTDVIDFSTMVLGYAVNFLPDNFYSTYAA